MYYLYRHIRLDKNEPFYIGIGKKLNSFNFWEQEYKRAYEIANRNNWWYNITSKTDFEVEIMYESDSVDEIKKKEIEFIALYGRKDLGKGTLVNLTDGGDGIKNINEKIRQILSNKAKLRILKNPEYQKQLIKKALEAKRKEVYQFDINGILINKFYNTVEAGNYIKSAACLVSTRCRTNSYLKGYYWSFVENPVFNKSKMFIPVLQQTIDGEIIKEWSDLRSIKHNTSFNISAIHNCFTGKCKTAYGFNWVYKNN